MHMKARIYLIISICILVFGCNRIGKKHFIVSGTVNDMELSVAMLRTNDSIYVDTIENGKFLFTIPTSSEKYIDLKLGSIITLYVKPNDSVFVNYTDRYNYSLSGKGFEESELLYKKEQLIKMLGFHDPRKIDIALFSSDTKVFKTKIDSIKQCRIKQIEDFKGLHPNISDSFYKIEKELVDYFVINQLFLFPEFHKILTKSEADLSDDYYGFTKDIKPDRKELYSFHEYKSAINSLLKLQTETMSEKYHLAKKLLTDRDFFEEMMYRDFRSYIRFHGIDNIDTLCVEFINELGDSKRKKILKDKYDGWKRLAKGEEAPDFEIKDEKGSIVHLSDFKGKYVYIDCWNTHCGPCIAEMPAMKKLSDDLANKNIVFVSICSDRNTERWLSKLREFDLNAVNLCTGGVRHDFFNDYNAKAFPRYILIDDQGLIIDATADKPSVIREELEKIK